jgi:DNA-binding transcriptional LysR family regulator
MYSITLQQIEYFLKVAETKYISEAANALYVSQPAVSKWLNRLEKDLGVRLFQRTRNGVVLTEEGKYLYSEWEQPFNRICASVQSVQHIHKSDEKVLCIGCLNSQEYIEILQDTTGQFKERFPDVIIIKEYYDHVELRQRLISGKIHAAVATSFSVEGIPNISYKNIRHARLYIALSASHPLAAAERLSVSDLRNELFYQLTPEIITNETVREFDICVKAGFYPKRIQYVPNGSSMIMAIKQGNGVAICDKLVNDRYDHDIKLYPIDEVDEAHYSSVAWRTNETSAVLRDFIGSIRGV